MLRAEILEIEQELAVYFGKDQGSQKSLNSRNRQGRVLSVHPSVLNLEFADRLVTVTGRKTEQAWDEIRLDFAGDLNTWDITPGEEVWAEEDGIRGEHFFLEGKKASVFRLPEPRLLLPAGAFPVDIDLWIYGHGKPSALYNGYFGEKDTSALGQLFSDTFRELREYMCDLTQEELLSTVMKLCGAGVGLTPSADDFLTGLFLLLALRFPERRPMYQQYAKEAVGRTVKIAARMMENAAAGRARVSELRLLEAMFAGDFAQTEHWLRQVAAFGSTSGTDTLIGIAFGVHYLNAIKGKEL